MTWSSLLFDSRCKIYSEIPPDCVLRKVDNCCFEPVCGNQGNVGTSATTHQVVSKTIIESSPNDASTNQVLSQTSQKATVVKETSVSSSGTKTNQAMTSTLDRIIPKQKRGGKSGTSMMSSALTGFDTSLVAIYFLGFVLEGIERCILFSFNRSTF